MSSSTTAMLTGMTTAQRSLFRPMSAIRAMTPPRMDIPFKYTNCPTVFHQLPRMQRFSTTHPSRSFFSQFFTSSSPGDGNTLSDASSPPLDQRRCKKLMKYHLEQVESLLEVERMVEMESQLEEAFQMPFQHRHFTSVADASDVLMYLEALLQKMNEAKSSGFIFANFTPFRAYWAAGTITQEMEDWDHALKYTQHAFELCDEDRMSMGLMKIAMGTIQMKMDALEAAAHEHQQGLDLIGAKVNLRNGHQVGKAYADIAQYHLHQYNSMASPVEDAQGDAREQLEKKRQENLVLGIKGSERAYAIFESYYGWLDPMTSELAVRLVKIYLQNNRVDLGIITAEKAMVALEFHLGSEETDPSQFTKVGMYLAKAYEKKRFFELQQNTITRVMNILKHREEQFDPQLYKECIFKLQNMLGTCRYLLGDNVMALSVFQKMAKQTREIYPTWSERDPGEANSEMGYMHYFMGSCHVGVERFDDAINLLQTAKEYFVRAPSNDWVRYCDQNIADAQKLQKEKPSITTEKQQAVEQ